MPAAPAEPAVVEQPSPATATPPPAENLNNAFSSLDSLFPQSEEAPAPAPKEPAKVEQPKQQAPKDTPKVTEQPKADQPKETPKEIAKVSPPQPEKAKTLREAKDMAEAKFKQTSKELTDLKAKYEALVAESSKAKDDPEKKTLAERLEAAEKRSRELDEKLRYKAYEETDEYKDKWEKPITTAYAAGRSKVAGLKVREGRQVDAEGNVVSEGTWRQGTPADFDRLMQFTDDESAADFAEKTFGNKASMAMYHRERVQELNQGRMEAISDYRKNGSEREKQFKETSEKQQKEINGQLETYWKKHQSAPIEKYPQLFKEIEGDEKGNALLQKGFRMASDAFASFNRATDPTLSAEQREKIIEGHAALFNWAMAGPRLAHQNAALVKELKDVKAELAEFKNSEPTDGTERKPADTTPRTDMDGILSGLDKLVARR